MNHGPRRRYRLARRSPRPLLRWVFLAPAYVGTVLHETAHALAIVALGGRVRRVVVGSGRVLAVSRVAGVRVEVRSPAWVNVGGRVRWALKRSRWRPSFTILVALAGPLATFAWLVIVLLILRAAAIPGSSVYFVVYAWLEFEGCRNDLSDVRRAWAARREFVG